MLEKIEFAVQMTVAVVLVVLLKVGEILVPPAPSAPAQTAAKDAAATKFWDWFQANADRLKDIQDPHAARFEELSQQLEKVHEGLTYEISAPKDGQSELVISADGIRERIPAVQQLIRTAPALPGWKFTAFRPRMDDLSEMEIQFKGIELRADQLWFRAEADSGQVALQIFLPGENGPEDDTLTGAAFILLDAALGEYDVMTRIGWIDWKPLPADPKAAGLLPWKDLPSTIDRLSADLPPKN